MGPRLAALVASLLVSGCSRTTPDTQYPPPPPSRGIPHIPLTVGDGEDEEIGGDDDEAPAPPPKPAGPAPVSADLPTVTGVAFDKKHACDKLCTLAKFLPEPALAAPGARSAAWVEQLGEKAQLALPRHGGLELLAVVLEGSVAVAPDDGTKPLELGAWGAARVQGLGVSLRTTGGKPATVAVVLVATAGELTEALGKAPAARWKKRPVPLEARAFADVSPWSWAGGAYHARVAFGGDAPRPALGLLIMSPGADVAEHHHEAEAEQLIVLRGGGNLTVSGTTTAVKAGAVLHIPTKAPHAFDGQGDEPTVAIQVYAPGGPEQRFRQLAAGTQ